MIEQCYPFSRLSIVVVVIMFDRRIEHICVFFGTRMCWRTLDLVRRTREKKEKRAREREREERKLLEIVRLHAIGTTEKRKKREQTTGRLLIKSGS